MGLVWTVVVTGTTIALSQRRYRQLAIVGATMLVLQAALVVAVASAARSRWGSCMPASAR